MNRFFCEILLVNKACVSELLYDGALLQSAAVIYWLNRLRFEIFGVCSWILLHSIIISIITSIRSNMDWIFGCAA